jgi:FkbM family methyltransferase
MRRLRKLATILASGQPLWIRSLAKGVPAGVEHRAMLGAAPCRTVVDVGANRGQFALAVRRHWPAARIFSFEPLSTPAAAFRRVFGGDGLVVLHEAAIGPNAEIGTMHLSRRDDSSSLLAITALQEETFPGTDEVGTVNVRVAPLSAFVGAPDIEAPALLKIDVQGYEMGVLRGCDALLDSFDRVYCECSFIELYEGQELADAVIEWLGRRGLPLTGVFNTAYDDAGRAVQADFLFERRRAAGNGEDRP